MRFLIAAVLFLVSLSLLVIGVAQRTVWAPDEHQSVSLKYDGTSPFLVIPNETLTMLPGSPEIVAQGNAKTFISYGRESDVQAWVGDTAYTKITVGKKQKLETSAVDGFGLSASPRGSDLWRAEIASATTSRLTVNPADSAAVLVASDGFSAAPGEIQLIWHRVIDNTPSTILLIAGSVVLIVAFILNIWGMRDLRRKRGPRRKMPKPPTGPKLRSTRRQVQVPTRGRRSAKARMVIALPASLIAISITAGCAPAATDNATPSASASDTAPQGPPPVVLEVQLNRILQSVSNAVAAADAESKKNLLGDRVIGPARDLREAYYVLRSRSRSIGALPPIAAKPVTFSLPAASDTWPRSIMAVTDEKGATTPPQLLVLQQDSPRENYKLWYNVRLMPGAEIPAVATADVGAIPVEANSLFLKLSPNLIPPAYGDLINKGPNSLNAGLFDVSNDEFYQQIFKSQKDQASSLKKAKITFDHKLGDPMVISLATTDSGSGSGALVAVYMIDSYVIKPTRAGSAVKVQGNEKLMLGSTGSATGVKSVYGNMLLFYVPAVADEGRIRLLGATQGLLSVRSL